MGLAANTEALAQAAPATTAQPPSAKPGRVTVERLKGGVLVIGFERVEAQNRLDPAIILGIGKAYYQLDHDDELRVGVLHGLGPDFSLGGDGPALAAAQAAGTFPPKDPDFLNPFNFAPWPHRAKPVVVAAQGGTKFGAHELFLAADIRVAASDTVFGQGEVTRGLFAWGGATVRFVREAGWGNAMRYLLTGDEWGPDEARRLGLLQEITPPGKQLDRAIELAGKIAAVAPLGVRATLASAHQPLSGEDAAFAALPAAFARLAQSEDAKEARRALQEKRAPVYRGI
ncbi:MAG TPA: enoyl-CoA hydratase-related protein [Xanthobacteraceae bacterium]|jgi:enoyl-CoA hydratase/carnithine racemase|nr:enoyl-CoA hydratase-related protein [Xanthobacteraceae bacterium]